jgi:hypothetical protein
MILHSPFAISARLLPAVQVGDAWISIEFAGLTSDGRARYRYHIDAPGLEHTGEDLKSGVGGGSLQSGMESLLDFLGAAAESYHYRGNRCTDDPDDNCNLFPAPVTQWAYQNGDEITMIRMELEENPNLITDGRE